MKQRRRFLRVFFSLSALFTAMALVDCGVDAVAVEGCRTLEFTRCEQGPYCPNLRVSDVAGCKRFYRDQCLRGLAVATDPGDPAINTCQQAIVAAGACAREGLAAAQCTGYEFVTEAQEPCDVVLNPHQITQCAFLLPTPSTGGSAGAAASTPTPAPNAGGAGSTATSGGGQGGAP